MKSNVKVSVITVVYNDVKNIEKTIKNVLKQTYTNLEYVVVDGASKDGTLDIIKRYEGKLRWISEPDKGIYDAMQKGANTATGEWIIFRNCGDYFITPDAIDKVFSQYTDNGEDFILCNSRYFKDYGYKDMKPSILHRHYFEAMPVNHPSTFIRRTVQLKYPFHLEYKNSADYCFFIEAFENGAKYKYIDTLVGLFDNNAGASTDNYDRSILENIDILSKFSAPKEIIDRLKINYKKLKIKNSIKKFMPFYSKYHSWNMNKQGWTKQELSETLKNI